MVAQNTSMRTQRHSTKLSILRESDCKNDLSPLMAELQGTIACVGEGDLDVEVSFSNRDDDIGHLGRNFNHMVRQLRKSREQAERLHCIQMSRAEHLATVGELAVGLAHEIRNPLAGIAGVIEILDSDLPVTTSARAVLNDVRLAIAQINRLLTDLLQTARPRPSVICPSDLNITVECAVRLARQQVLSKPIKIELKRESNLPNIEHDSDQIQRMLMNLLLNAVQAIGGAGTIRVETSSSKGDITISVIDTGGGIAPEHVPNIFNPFYTTKHKGTGLGLALVSRIVEDHHGRVEVTSEVGKGTNFLVFLPLSKGH